jgi:putative oxidoreductase
MEIKTIIFWVLIAAYAVPGLIFGFKKLSGHKEPAAHFNRWGYPMWFMHFLGFTEITCSILILFNTTRLYGIAIFSIIIAGAVYKHSKYDTKKEVMKPVYAGVFLVTIFLFAFWV